MGVIRAETVGDCPVFVLEDRASGSTARVATGYGFNCYSFQCRVGGQQWELIAAEPSFVAQRRAASASGIPVLFPFPNRIGGGRFEFGGRSWQLPLNEPGRNNAIHGLVIERAWRVTETEGVLTGQFRASRDAADLLELWPADFQIELTYQLQAASLSCRVRIYNPDSKPLPFGFGTHPYFRLPLQAGGDEGQCTVQVPVSEVWELDESLLPTGRRRPAAGPLDLGQPRPLADVQVDNAFTGARFDHGWCRCHLTDRAAGVQITYRFDELFRHVVVYTPPQRGSICIEPYTCITDAVNLEARGIPAGWRVLPPGQTVQGAMVIEVSS